MAKQKKRPTKTQKAAVSAVADVALTFDSPESSLILRGSYDPATLTLIVEFTSGRVYIYAGVAPETWMEMQASESKGKFFNAYIRPFILGREK